MLGRLNQGSIFPRTRVIDLPLLRHYGPLASDLLTGHPAEGSSSTQHGERLPASALRRLVRDHYDFIWRLLARLNVAGPEVDDAAQQVFMVLVSREGLSIKPGSERAFLYGVALRVAKEFRRRAQSSIKRTLVDPETLVDQGADVESIADRSRARLHLNRILGRMPENLKEVFILFELEGMSVPQMAELLSIPVGTTASRLRRAREVFQIGVGELRAANRSGGLA